VVFQVIMTKLNFKNSYDDISVTSSPLRSRKNITKITSQFFFNLALSINISGYASGCLYVKYCADGPANIRLILA